MTSNLIRCGFVMSVCAVVLCALASLQAESDCLWTECVDTYADMRIHWGSYDDICEVCDWSEATICQNAHLHLLALPLMGIYTREIDSLRFCENCGGSTNCTDPLDYQSDYPVHWSWAGDIADPGDSFVALFKAQQPGDYTVTCTISDTFCADPSQTAKWHIHVRPSGPPDCEDTVDECSVDSGGGCQGCGSGGGNCDMPMPSLRNPVLSSPCPDPYLNDPSGGGYAPDKGCKAGQFETVDMCDGVYVKYWDCTGKCHVIGPYSEGQDFTFCPVDKCYSGHVNQDRTVKIRQDGGGDIEFARGLEGTSFIGYPTATIDSGGNRTSFVRAANGALEQITTPNGERWLYEHTDVNFPTHITKITAPDGRYTVIAYKSSGAAAGKIESTATYAAGGGEPLSQTTYTYDDVSGKLLTATKGAIQVRYEYNTNQILVEECNAANPSEVFTRTLYWYGSAEGDGEIAPAADQTWVIRKHATDPNQDQVTKYTFYTESGKKTHFVKKVVDPLGAVTEYVVDLQSGRTTEVIGPNGVRTRYTYNTTNPEQVLLTKVEVLEPAPSENPLSTEEYTYYPNSSWIETHKDVRGNITKYIRDTNNPELVTAVQVAPASQPTNFTTIKEYEYYIYSPTDITDSADLEYDQRISDCNTANWSCDQLRDGYVGDGHEDVGEWGSDVSQWDYPGCIDYGNHSCWNWASARYITNIDLYCAKENLLAGQRRCGTDLPAQIVVYAKDATGSYYLLFDSGCRTQQWQEEIWNQQTVMAVHVSVNVYTTGLKIVYGGPNRSRLGEIVINGFVCPEGLPGQLKKEIVPNIDGDIDYVVEYKYSDADGKLYDSPTQTIHQYWNGSAYESKTSYTYYDDAGRVKKTTDTNGRSVWYLYDELGRQTDTVYEWADTEWGTPAVYTHNEYSCCNLLWTRDENGNKTYYDYDAANRIVGVWTDVQGDENSQNRLVTYSYDSFGNKAAVTTFSDSGTPRVTTYAYDKNNRVTKIVYPYESTEGDLLWNEYFQYDNRGNLVAKLVGMESNGTITAGSVTAYQYDLLGRLVKVRYNYPTNQWPVSDINITNGHVEYSYDGSSSLRTSVVEKNDGGIVLRTSTYQYDMLGRIERYTPPVGLDGGYYVSYTYNKLEQKMSVRITNDTITPYNVGYEYFANGWLKKVKNGANTIAEYIYDAVGNRVRIDFGNGTYTTYSYDSDPRYRVNSIAHYRAGTPAVELATISYATRDAVGNPESIADWVGTWSYGYDANNRLDWALVPDVLGGPAARVVSGQPAGGDYVYDWVGNRLRPPYGTGNEMVYNKADQLIRWPGMHIYAYDGAGNLTQVKNDSETQVVNSYTYTPTGLLDTATFKDNSGSTRTLSNLWDADSNRVSFNANGTEYELIYDPTAGIPAVIEESSGGISVYYIREPGGELIARLHPTEGIRYYHFDELGSTRLLTDGSGNVTDRYAYDAYGSMLSHDRYSGSVNQPYQYVGQLGYYTHWMEPDFGLLQLGVRFYDPEVGRFTQRDIHATDTVADAVYADGNPLALVDPSGKKCRKVDPNDPRNYIGNCLQQLRNCLPCIKNSQVTQRGMDRTKTWEYCDHPNPNDDGDTYCGVFRRVCKIRIWRNKTTTCETVLHELLHASWWYTENNDEMKITNAASLAYQYYCDKKSACYGGTPRRSDQAELRKMLGCSSLP